MKTSKQLKIKRMKNMKKFDVRITQEIRDIIHGYVMGDGYLKDDALQVDQGIKQEKFVNWLYEKLKPICTDHGPQLVKRTDKRNGNVTQSCRFNTRRYLSGFASMWYRSETDSNGKTDRKKTLPKSIKCFFNSTFVTLWFAGDGTNEPDCRAAKIEVTAFTPKERQLLKMLFCKKFKIKTAINKAGKSEKGTDQWVLRIPASEYDKFRALITEIDLIPTLFPHKLHKDNHNV